MSIFITEDSFAQLFHKGTALQDKKRKATKYTRKASGSKNSRKKTVLIDEGTLVIGEIYENVLQNNFWQPLKSQITRRQYWFQQDGAPFHCTSANLKFLPSKFHERVISRRSSFPWAAHSPDPSPLDYWLWNQLKKEV